MESAWSWVDTSLDLNINPGQSRSSKALKPEFEGEAAHCPVKDEAGVLVKELNRVSAENKKLTEMLTVLCEQYYALQQQFNELVSNNSKTEAVNISSKKRKAECEDYTKNLIGFSGNTEGSSKPLVMKTRATSLRTALNQRFQGFTSAQILQIPTRL